MRLLISDEVHQRQIRRLGREDLCALHAAPQEGGRLTMSLGPEQGRITSSAVSCCLMTCDANRLANADPAAS
jgi:hypothetical protein